MLTRGRVSWSSNTQSKGTLHYSTVQCPSVPRKSSLFCFVCVESATSAAVAMQSNQPVKPAPASIVLRPPTDYAPLCLIPRPREEQSPPVVPIAP